MSEGKNIFLTGRPGIGKTTVIKKVLKKVNKPVSGIVTPEIRKEGKRIGFGLKDVETGEEGLLASVELENGPKIGKYTVNLEDLSKFSEKIINSIERKELIVIDEIGPMELFSERFKEAVEKVLESKETNLLATIHRSKTKDFASKGEIIQVTKENRDKLPKEIIGII